MLINFKTSMQTSLQNFLKKKGNKKNPIKRGVLLPCTINQAPQKPERDHSEQA